MPPQGWAKIIGQKWVSLDGHQQILNESSLESAFNIPRDSARAFVFVLDTQGNAIARVEGEPNDAKLSEVEKAVRSTK